jgi:hypothetical protein
MTTVTLTQTNAAAASSEKLADASNQYRLSLLRLTGQDTSTLPIETTEMPARSQSNAPSGFTEHPVSQANRRRLEAIRTALRLVDDPTARQADLPTAHVSGMQKWQGRILEVDEEYFSAELVPFEGGAAVIADFARDLLSDEDDLQAGDVIYVTVRTVGPRGRRTRTSAVRLRRLGRWTEAEIADQSRRAKERLSELSPYLE